MALALAAATFVLRLWDANLHVPLQGALGDGAIHLSVVKGVLEHGWYWTNPSLGAPFGQDLYDVNVLFGDALSFLLIKLLGVGSSDPVAVFNVFYVLTYPLCAGTAYAALRALGLERPLACFAGVLFALLPYHLLRGTGHLMLSAYYAVPLGCWLILATLGSRPLFSRGTSRSRWLRWASGRTALTVAICLVVGASSLYYGFFAALLLLVTLPLVAIARRSIRAAVPPLVAALLIVATMTALQAPVLVYQARHGSNQSVAKRVAFESEIYALKLTSLVLPRNDHRVAPLARLGERYYTTTPLLSEGTNAGLGLLGSAGLLAGLLAIAAAVMGVRLTSPRARLLRDAGVSAWAAILIGTVGGGSALIAYLITPQARAWNRISIYVAFFALVSLCVVLSAGFTRLSRRGAPTAVALAGLAALGVLGVLDQTSARDAPDHAAVRAVWGSDARFVRAIEEQMPPGAMVLQLPYVPFPENPPVERMVDYDQLKGYVHSRDLQWTYGQIKGRPQDWADTAASLPMPELVPAAAAAGFQGIYVDRFGYRDDGGEIERGLRELLPSEEPISSQDGRLLFFSLVSYRERLMGETTRGERDAAAAALVEPIELTTGSGVYPPEPGPNGPFNWATSKAAFNVTVPGDASRVTQVHLRLFAPGPSETVVTLQQPNGPSTTMRVPPEGRTFTRLLTFPSGRSQLVLSTSGPRAQTSPADQRDLRLRVEAVTVEESALERLETASSE